MHVLFQSLPAAKRSSFSATLTTSRQRARASRRVDARFRPLARSPAASSSVAAAGCRCTMSDSDNQSASTSPCWRRAIDVTAAAAALSGLCEDANSGQAGRRTSRRTSERNANKAAKQAFRRRCSINMQNKRRKKRAAASRHQSADRRVQSVECRETPTFRNARRRRDGDDFICRQFSFAIAIRTFNHHHHERKHGRKSRLKKRALRRETSWRLPPFESFALPLSRGGRSANGPRRK